VLASRIAVSLANARMMARLKRWRPPEAADLLNKRRARAAGRKLLRSAVDSKVTVTVCDIDHFA
jgi:hypothetical protein